MREIWEIDESNSKRRISHIECISSIEAGVVPGASNAVSSSKTPKNVPLTR